jgi:hypothetical protein
MFENAWAYTVESAQAAGACPSAAGKRKVGEPLLLRDSKATKSRTGCDIFQKRWKLS